DQYSPLFPLRKQIVGLILQIHEPQVLQYLFRTFPVFCGDFTVKSKRGIFSADNYIDRCLTLHRLGKAAKGTADISDPFAQVWNTRFAEFSIQHLDPS